MNMDRFQGPTRADDYVWCVGCVRKVHYEFCDDNGFCGICRNEQDDDERKDEK